MFVWVEFAQEFSAETTLAVQRGNTIVSLEDVLRKRKQSLSRNRRKRILSQVRKEK